MCADDDGIRFIRVESHDILIQETRAKSTQNRAVHRAVKTSSVEQRRRVEMSAENPVGYGIKL